MIARAVNERGGTIGLRFSAAAWLQPKDDIIMNIFK